MILNTFNLVFKTFYRILILGAVMHNVWQVMHQIHQNNLIKDITQTKNHQAELMQNCTIHAFLRLFIGT